MSAGWEVDCDAQLATDLRGSTVFAAENPQTESKSIVNRDLRADHALQLRLICARAVRYATIDFAAYGEAGRDIVQHREAARIHLAATSLNAYRAGAGITGEQEAHIR